jgi:hypothetical protein
VGVFNKEELPWSPQRRPGGHRRFSQPFSGIKSDVTVVKNKNKKIKKIAPINYIAEEGIEDFKLTRLSAL